MKKVLFNPLCFLLILGVVFFTFRANFSFVEAKNSKEPEPAGQAKKEEPKFVPGEILIKFKEKVEPSREKSLEEFGPEPFKPILKGKAAQKLNIYKKKVPQGKEQEAIEKLSKNPKVEYAERNGIVEISLVPNDPYYSSTGSWGQSYPDLWGLHKISTEQAWDITTGSEQVVVAVIDTGVDYNHEDLAGNMATNPGEIGNGKENNGLDDDQNGYIDDWRGWDFVHNNNDPMDDHGHGSHCAGTIAAVGNNALGVVGVSWKTKIYPIKFLDAQGRGTSEGAVKALTYGADLGIKISSNSWGGGYSQSVNDAVKYAHQKGQTVVVAAGNSATDALYYSPASSANAVTVGATQPDDSLAPFSNIGPKIDVTAPGVDILSVRASNTSRGNVLNDKYTRASGTSMATPHVAGLASLVLALHPEFSNEEIRSVINASADDLGDPDKDKNFGYGRINAQKALLIDHPLSAHISSPFGKVYGQVEIVGSASGLNFSNYRLEYGQGEFPSTWNLIKTSTSPVTNGVLGVWDTSLISDGIYTLRVVSQNTLSEEFEGRIKLEADNAWISFPVSGNILNPQSSLTVTGRAIGTNFESYKLEYSPGRSQTNWILIIQSNSPVLNGTLAIWDTTFINNPDDYLIKLTVLNSDGHQSLDQVLVNLDPTLHSGWPKKIGTWTAPGIAAVGDVNGDGEGEIVFSVGRSLASGIHAIYKHDGQVLTYLALDSDYTDLNAPILFDLDRDGKKEIIATSSAYLYIWRGDGSRFPGWEKGKATLGDPYNNARDIYSSAPAVADIDKDGQYEVVATSYCYKSYKNCIPKLYVYSQDGALENGFPKDLASAPPDYDGYDYAYTSPPSLTDIDNDGFYEIFVGGFDHNFHAFRFDGSYLPGFPKTVDKRYVHTTPAIADLDQDGQKEIIFGTADSWLWIGSLYVIRSDGSTYPGWPKESASSFYSSPAIADLDGDGDLEIASGASFIKVFHHNGDQILNWYYMEQKNGNSWASETCNTSLAIADLDGDKVLDILGVCGDYDYEDYDHLFAVRIDGTMVSGFPKAIFDQDYLDNTPLIADIDNDNSLEIIVASDYNYQDDLKAASLFVWDTPTFSEDKAPWSIYHHDERLTGLSHLATINQPPRGSILVNNGDIYTNSLNVTLNLEAHDENGVASMVFSNDGFNWSLEEPYSTTKSWALTSGDGEKNVYVKYKDKIGLWSLVYSDSIILDVTSPVGSISINSDASYTNSQTVTLNLFASDSGSGVTEMAFSDDGISWTTWEPYQATKSWTLSSDNGTKIVYVKYRDRAKNEATYSDSIALDTTPPTGSILINGGASRTKSQTVTLTLSSSDNISGVVSMRLSNDGINWNAWESYVESKTWNLTSGRGTKYVYVQYQDRAGNISKTYSNSIYLQK